jgi:Protein of unknown function (DUF2851)
VALWYSGAFGTAFRSTTGALIEIIQFGFWNREPGPDFIHAAIRIDGRKELKGDIELDLHVADWDRHGHSANSAFDQVILHLFLHRSGADHFTRTTEHREIPQVHLRKEVEHLAVRPPIAHPGNCCAPLQLLTDPQVDGLIETAAQVRIERKSEQFRRASLVHGTDEALFQAVAAALGYKPNKIAFLLLAQRAKLRDLREQGSAAESILFGLAGFLEDPLLNDSEARNREYWGMLWEHWWRVRNQFAPYILKPGTWKFGMTRPSNHPHRRLGALAEIARRWRELRMLPPELEAVADWFQRLTHPFWDWHFTLASRTTRRAVRLIGDARINEILANVISPMLFTSSRENWDAYKRIRSELGNRNLEFADDCLAIPNEPANTFNFFTNNKDYSRYSKIFVSPTRPIATPASFLGWWQKYRNQRANLQVLLRPSVPCRSPRSLKLANLAKPAR